MKSLTALRALSALTGIPSSAAAAAAAATTFSYRFYSAQPQADLSSSTAPGSSDSDAYDNDAVFDSSHFTLPGASPDTKTLPQPTWDEKYRSRADKLLFGEEIPQKGRLRISVDEEENRQRVLARALLEAAIEAADDEDMTVKEEDQKSLAVGIIGAPNAGKSALTNCLVRLSHKYELLCAYDILGIHFQGFQCALIRLLSPSFDYYYYYR